MSFPDELLPCAERKQIDCELSGHYLLRHTSTQEEEQLRDPLTGGVQVRAVCDPSAHVSDLSTSLHGVFRTEHCAIELTQEGKSVYNDYCAPDAEVDRPQKDVHFRLNEVRGYWMILVSWLDGQRVDYTLSGTPFVAVCSVVHTPMLWNYWHFSVRWRLEDGRMLNELPDKERQKVVKKIGHDARAIIAKFARLTEPPEVVLPPECYLKDAQEAGGELAA